VRDSYTAALTFRMGLPWSSQISATLPFEYNQFRDGSSSSGLADAGFLFSKALLVESDWMPNLVGSIGWTSPTSLAGKAFSPIPYVSGFQAGVTASKTFDPLVVFGGVSYFSSISREIAVRDLILAVSSAHDLAAHLQSALQRQSLLDSILAI
jgi:hypothetical protein